MIENESKSVIKKRSEIRIEKEAKALQRNLLKRKKQTEEREKLKKQRRMAAKDKL